MPELPEVETTLRGISSYIILQRIVCVTVRQPKLRWPIPKNLASLLKTQTITELSRRGKYLLLKTKTGTLLIHLGMSGSLCIKPKNTPYKKHDHVDIEFANQLILRFTDPRRFGAILWIENDVAQHVLLKNLGKEPLDPTCNGNYLWQKAQRRNVQVKIFIMDNKVLTGVGNIYATEALFLAGIHPTTSVKQLSKQQFELLAKAIKKILRLAIKQGGTTLRDFLHSEGKPGYFINSLQAYGRNNLTCFRCNTKIESIRIGQRNSYFCRKCQPIKF